MPGFIRKPNTTIVLAARWEGTLESARQIADLGARLMPRTPSGVGTLRLWTGVDGAQGWTELPIGHWVMRGAPNDFYPVDHQYMLNNFDVAPGEALSVLVEDAVVAEG